jgi:hypothetical protein
VEAAAGTARRKDTGPGERAMTRHGIQPSAAGTQPPAARPRASMVIIDVDRAASDRATNRRCRAAGRRGGPCASIAALLDGGHAIPDTSRNPKSHSHRVCPAGSFLGDFRTPAGARNSSRQPAGSFRRPESKSGRAVQNTNTQINFPKGQ